MSLIFRCGLKYPITVSWELCSCLGERCLALWCPLYNEVSYRCRYLHKALYEIIISSGTSFYDWSGPAACNVAMLGSSWIPSPENTLLKNATRHRLNQLFFMFRVSLLLRHSCRIHVLPVWHQISGRHHRCNGIEMAWNAWVCNVFRMWSAFCSLKFSCT